MNSTPTASSRPRLTPGIVAAGVFGTLYIATAGVAAGATGNAEFLFYVVVMIVLAGVILAVHWRFGLSTELIWLLAVWGLLHMAGGLVPVPGSWPIAGEIRVLYSWWILHDGERGFIKYDHLVHAYGYGVTAWLVWQSLEGLLRQRFTVEAVRPTAGLMVIVAVASMGFGAINEIVEFIATLFAETNVGGYVNTGWDLVANGTGAVLACGLILLRRNRA